MPVILRVTAGPAAGTEFRLEPGVFVQVGRGRLADLVLTADMQLSPLHFSLECDTHACRVSDLDSRGGTQVNGVRIVQSLARNGDRIAAGLSTFQLEIAPDATGTVADEDAGSPVTARMLLDDIEPSEPALALLDDVLAPLEYLDAIIAQGLWRDAALILARWLPKPDAVSWVGDCVEQAGRRAEQAGKKWPQAEQAALRAAQAWAADPTEQQRRLAEAAAQQAKYAGAASFVAMGAVWSGGSLAPIGLPDVPPAPHLTAKGLYGALQMAAAQHSPLNPLEALQSFVQNGRERYAPLAPGTKGAGASAPAT